MNKRIFRSTVAVAILVLAASIVIIMGILFEHFEGQIIEELRSEAKFISHAVESEGMSYLDNLDTGDKRITLISADGEVLFDTYTDSSKLDNHADRGEVMQAMLNGYGTSTRYSQTMMQKIVYYAVKMNDGNVLRISTTQYTVVAILLGLLQPLIVVLLLALILSFILSSRVSKSIIKPINELNLDDPASNLTYDELTPLLSRIAGQRKTIENQLNEAKKKQEEFRLITENMSEGFLVIDSSTNLLTYNSAALKLLGIDEVKSGSVLILNRTRSFRTVVDKVLGGERTESSMTLADRSYNLIANPVMEGDVLIGAVIIILDVTEGVKREQLRREFTSNVSHELKTPLTSISGFAEIMKDGQTPQDTVRDFSKSIYDEAQRLISLVNDIIKISELDEKTIEFDMEDVDLYELSKEIIGRLKPEADKRGIKFSLIGASASVYGARKILDEMIYNLCDNAVKYNKDNGIVDVIVNSSDKKTSIIVRDSGIGIPMSEQGRVFERFYRVDKSHSKAIGGTGLGLSIVKHGALYHNAEISLESTEGQGTSITITF